jgi:GntR family transcriptional regulator / MocR family aminotransferase
MEDSPPNDLFDQTNIGHLLWYTDESGPAFARVARAIREGITAGLLRTGDALPPSRALAHDLGVSRWVVVEAYEQLKAEGYLVARSGAATRVAALPWRDLSGPAPDTSAGAGSVKHDLSPGLPDLARFPRPAWKRAYNAALQVLSHTDLGYPPPDGLAQFRESVAGWLRRVRGMAVAATDVQVSQGTSQGIRAVFQLLAAGSRTVVAVEDPCWPHAAQAARDFGLTMRAVPVDSGGIDVEQLVTQRTDAVYLTPAHQFPTGVVLNPSRRHHLLRWAAVENVLLIEDDYDAELRYDRRPVGPLAAAASHHVAYLGSPSKALAPALRIGWLVLPPALRTPMTELLARSRSGPGALDQLAMANLIDHGSYDRHLRHSRREYGYRRDELTRAIRDAIPDARVREPAAGLHVVIDLPVGVTEAAVLEGINRQDFCLRGMSSYRVAPSPERQALLLGFGQLPSRDVPAFVRTLADCVDAARIRPASRRSQR